jgi:membrane protease YdiL (CAAX protease family)
VVKAKGRLFAEAGGGWSAAFRLQKREESGDAGFHPSPRQIAHSYSLKAALLCWGSAERCFCPLPFSIVTSPRLGYGGIMLSAKPWKAEAIIRLVLSVMVCVYAGGVLLSAGHYVKAGGKAGPWLFYPLASVATGCLVATLIVIGRPWPAEAFGRRMLTLLVCAYAGLFLGAWVQRLVGESAVEASIWRMVVATLCFQGAGLFLIARFLREQQSTWKEGFGMLNRPRHAVLLGLVVALIFLPLGWGLQQASALVMTHLPHFKLEPQEQLPVHALRMSMSGGGRLALGAAAVLLAPVAEEAVFRGIIYPAIKQFGYPRLALWGTSLLFAAVHMNLVTFVPLATLAVVLTMLYERTDNLLAPITAHVLFNALNFATLLVLQQTGGL